MVLKKMLQQNDTDTLYLHKRKGRWDQNEFKQIRDNFIIEIKVTEEEIDFMRGVGVPELDILTCVRLRTKRDHSTVARRVVWYDCSELLSPQYLRIREFGVFVEDLSVRKQTGGTQREYSSKPLKQRIVKRILVFKL